MAWSEKAPAPFSLLYYSSLALSWELRLWYHQYVSSHLVHISSHNIKGEYFIDSLNILTLSFSFSCCSYFHLLSQSKTWLWFKEDISCHSPHYTTYYKPQSKRRSFPLITDVIFVSEHGSTPGRHTRPPLDGLVSAFISTTRYTPELQTPQRARRCFEGRSAAGCHGNSWPRQVRTSHQYR